MPNYLNTNGLRRVWGRIKELVSTSCNEVSKASTSKINSSVNTLQGKINDQKLIKLKYSNNVLVMYDPAQDNFVDFSWQKASDYINTGRVIQLTYGNKQYYLSAINNTMMTFMSNGRNGNQGELFTLQFLKQDDSYKVITDTSITYYNTDYIDQIKSYAEGHVYQLCEVTRNGREYSLPMSFTDFNKLAKNNAVALLYGIDIYYQYSNGVFMNFTVNTGDMYNIQVKQFVITNNTITFSTKQYGSNDFIEGTIVSSDTIEIVPPQQEGVESQPRRLHVQKGKLYVSNNVLFKGDTDSFVPIYPEYAEIIVAPEGTSFTSSTSNSELWKLMKQDRVIVKTEDSSYVFRLAGMYDNSANYTCVINGGKGQESNFIIASLVFTYIDDNMSVTFNYKEYEYSKKIS